MRDRAHARQCQFVVLDADTVSMAMHMCASRCESDDTNGECETGNRVNADEHNIVGWRRRRRR